MDSPHKGPAASNVESVSMSWRHHVRVNVCICVNMIEHVFNNTSLLWIKLTISWYTNHELIVLIITRLMWFLIKKYDI